MDEGIISNADSMKLLAGLEHVVALPKRAKPKAKRPPSKLDRVRARRVAKKTAAKKPKVKAKTPAKKAAKPKTKRPAKVVVRSERMDLRLSKSEKAAIQAKAKKLRRTLTSLFVEFVEKLK